MVRNDDGAQTRLQEHTSVALLDPFRKITKPPTENMLLDPTTWCLKFTWSPPHDLSAHVKDFFPIPPTCLITYPTYKFIAGPIFTPTQLTNTKLSTSCSCVKTPQFATSVCFSPKKKCHHKRIVGSSRHVSCPMAKNPPGAVPISETLLSACSAPSTRRLDLQGGWTTKYQGVMLKKKDHPSRWWLKQLYIFLKFFTTTICRGENYPIWRACFFFKWVGSTTN